jgi:copper homeostasis protein (lipoprotein)
VLEATLLEMAEPGTPGRVIGSALVGGPGPSPIRFRVPFDPAQIDTARRYGVRARLLAARSVLYLTDGEPPAVLTHGHGREAAISLAPAAITRQLPASFTGSLPCDGCVGVRYQIDLLPDSVFYLRAVRRQAADSTVRVDIGRWTLDAGGARLTLHGEKVESFAPVGASVLRQVDAAGRPIVSGPEHDLLRNSALAPLEPELELRGLYREGAAGALFTDCRTARPLPVVAGGARAALQTAYRRVRAGPEADVLVRFDGRIVRTGALRASAVAVVRVLGASRAEGC